MFSHLGRRASTIVLWWALVLTVLGAGVPTEGAPGNQLVQDAQAASRPGAKVKSSKQRIGKEPAATLRTKSPGPRNEIKPNSTKVTRAIRQVGRSVDFAAKKLERAGRRSDRVAVKTFTRRFAKALSLFFGEETLVSMSFRGGFGLAVAFPGAAQVIGGVGGAINIWSGSVEYYEDHVPVNGKTMHVNAGAGLSTLAYAASYDRRKELTHSVGISLASASVSPRRFAISSGIPLLFGVALGEEQGMTSKDFSKGPFFRVTSRIVPFVNMTAEIYYRPLGAITQKLRPLAVKVRDFNVRVAKWVQTNLRPAWWPKGDPGTVGTEEQREEQPIGPVSWQRTGSGSLGFA